MHSSPLLLTSFYSRLFKLSRLLRAQNDAMAVLHGCSKIQIPTRPFAPALYNCVAIPITFKNGNESHFLFKYVNNSFFIPTRHMNLNVGREVVVVALQ